MARIRHLLAAHKQNKKTESLIIGTFNPATSANPADFFYGRSRNFLWTLLPVAFGEPSLKGRSRKEKLLFMKRHRIDFIDLIHEVEVDEVANYRDDYLDDKVLRWTDIISVIDTLPALKRVAFTRRSFGGVPHIKARIDAVEDYCRQQNITFRYLTTPARIYSEEKQQEWTKFFQGPPEL